MNFLTEHWELAMICAVYVAYAAVNSLPDPSQKFEFYPWFYHVCKSLLNSVPPQYKPKSLIK